MKTLLCEAFYLLLHVYATTVLFTVKVKRTQAYEIQEQEEGEVAFSIFRCFRMGEVEDTQSLGHPNFSSENSKKIAPININLKPKLEDHDLRFSWRFFEIPPSYLVKCT